MADKTQFHTVSIKGLAFAGVLSIDGPYLLGPAPLHRGVALAVSSIGYFSTLGASGRPSGWWVVKYADERRIHLPGFDEADATTLARHFGLAVFSVDGWAPMESAIPDFYTSPAWRGLLSWVQRHPRLAARYGSSENYLPGWYGRALSEIGRNA